MPLYGDSKLGGGVESLVSLMGLSFIAFSIKLPTFINRQQTTTYTIYQVTSNQVYCTALHCIGAINYVLTRYIGICIWKLYKNVLGNNSHQPAYIQYTRNVSMNHQSQNTAKLVKLSSLQYCSLQQCLFTFPDSLTVPGIYV